MCTEHKGGIIGRFTGINGLPQTRVCWSFDMAEEPCCNNTLAISTTPPGDSAAGTSQWRIQGGGAQGAWAPPFSQQTRSRIVRAWLHGILCAPARARVSAFYIAGSCTQAMMKRDIRTLTSVLSRADGTGPDGPAKAEPLFSDQVINI